MPFIEHLIKNAGNPSAGTWGVFMKTLFKLNKRLEKKAVDLLKIRPNDNVLEIGFGTGHGISCVLNETFLAGRGMMYGVDYSAYMCEHVKKQFRQYTHTGKLTILNEDVARMSLPDGIFDKVFHTHSHLYWEDLQGGCSEIHRVMKPESTMVTVMNYAAFVRVLGAAKFIKNLEVEQYLSALKTSGFVDIEMLKLKSGLLAITSSKP